MSQYPSAPSAQPGQPGQPGHHDQAGQVAATANRGRVFSIIGAVCGVVALLFVPILFGPAGIALGFVGHAKGDRPLGMIVGIGSIVTTIAGMIIGAVVMTQLQG